MCVSLMPHAQIRIIFHAIMIILNFDAVESITGFIGDADQVWVGGRRLVMTHVNS